MSVAWSALLETYTASLRDAASVFAGADLERHLRMAARAMARKRTRTLVGSLSLVADQALYSAVPADLIAPKISLWGNATVKPWLLPRGPLPVLSLVATEDAPALRLTPAPSAEQISAFGSDYAYYYLAEHSIDVAADTTTVPERDQDLLVLRAQAEALREISIRDAHKPVSLRNASPSGGVAKVGLPAALYQSFLAEFEAAA